MKQFITISFLLLYLTFSVGVNILVHTCGGESETSLVTTSADDPCACSGEMPTDMCCTTVVKTLQLDDTQKASIITLDEQLTLLDTAPIDQFDAEPIQNPYLHALLLTSSSPPPLLDLCITNSVFLI